MENGIEAVDERNMEHGNGLHNPKNSEGDEFFAASTYVETPRAVPRIVPSIRDASDEKDGDLIANPGLDEFEDAVGFPVKVPNSLEGLGGVNPVEGVKFVGSVDQQSLLHESSAEQLNGPEAVGSVDVEKNNANSVCINGEQLSLLNGLEKDKDDLNEVSEIDNGGKSEISENVGELNDIAGPAVVASDIVNSNGLAFSDNSEPKDEIRVTNEIQENEDDFRSLDGIGTTGDHDSESKDAISVTNEFQANENDFRSLDGIETTGAHDSGANDIDLVDESGNNLLIMENQSEVEACEGKEQKPLDPALVTQNDTYVEQATLSNVVVDDQNGKSEELVSASVTIASENNVEASGIESRLHSAIEERIVTRNVEGLPPLSAERKTQVSLPDLGTSFVKASQLSSTDASVKVSDSVAGVSTGGGLESDQQQQRTPVKTAQEPRPASEAPQSVTMSPVAAPAPVLPAGPGRAAPRLESAPRVVPQPRANGTATPAQNQVADDLANGVTEEIDDTREKLQMIRVKFLRLAHRLGQTPHNAVVAQVLYRLGLAEQLRGRNGGRVGAFSFERASAVATQLEATGQAPLDFSCTIMVLGKTGVGKSATINSIFDEVKFGTDAFQLGTKKVQDVVGTVQGIKVRVIDTPGLLPSCADQRQNNKILHSVKRFIQKSPPDIVLYLDRLDMQSRDFGDMPLLKTITEIFGPSIWFNAIVVLTHAASAPPEGPNGTATSYDMYVTQRSHVVQQAIRQAAGDMRLMNPVSLVENHSACRTNRDGQRVLPNGQIWKPHLLLLSFASKILAEANMLLKLQDSSPGKPFATRMRAPPLPFLLSSLLQSRQQLKLPQEQFGDDEDTLDDSLDDNSDEETSEYDELPPFKRLTNAQVSKLSKAEKKAYYDELEYREKLFMKKQLKEEKKRRKLMKKMAEAAKDLPSDYNDNVEEDNGGASTVPATVQDLNLPVSFDSDNPTHRYRSLDAANSWLVRPVLDPHGWDHDVGYEGINVENLIVIKEKIPISLSGQVTKDKKDCNFQCEVSSSVKHGEGKSTTLALDMQTVGKEMSYTLRSETRFINYWRNRATAGLSATYIGDVLTGGVKLEDKIMVTKRGQLVVAGGAIVGRGDVAYGASLEATLRDKDHPLGRFLSTVGLSVMDWHGDLALGLNAQTQIPIGKFNNLIGRVNMNNRGSGQVSIRLNSSEHLQIVLVALIPLFNKLHGYYQSLQYVQG